MSGAAAGILLDMDQELLDDYRTNPKERSELLKLLAETCKPYDS